MSYLNGTPPPYGDWEDRNQGKLVLAVALVVITIIWIAVDGHMKGAW